MAAIIQQQQQQNNEPEEYEERQRQPHSIQILYNSTQAHNMSGLGLLTTVASLPPKYRSRYLNIKIKSEIPLDLSKKPATPPPPPPPPSPSQPSQPSQHNDDDNDVPIATNFTEIVTEPSHAICNDTPSPSSQVQIQLYSQSVSPNAGSLAGVNVTSSPIIEEMSSTIHDNGILIPLDIQNHHVKPITPPLTPIKRTFADLEMDDTMPSSIATNSNMNTNPNTNTNPNPITNLNKLKMNKMDKNETVTLQRTPNKPIRITDKAIKTSKIGNSMMNNKINGQVGMVKVTSKALATSSGACGGGGGRQKATRKLKFDEDTSSPVSGTIIRPLEDITGGTVQYSNGDIDPKYNIVEMTEETKAELAAIRNVIGDYICKLCRLKFDDAFGLAQHRCACIVLLEYRCPECGKQFNCPANLASHRRWHKPRKNATPNNPPNNSPNNNNIILNKKENLLSKVISNDMEQQQQQQQQSVLQHECTECGKKFKRPAYLRKHQLTHNKNHLINNNENSENSIAIKEAVTVSSGVEELTSENNENNENRDGILKISSNIRNSISSDDLDERHLYIYEDNTNSECSLSSNSSCKGYGRLQIIESDLTEEENIAAAALTNLRNCASVIQHTTYAH